jgi:hypothetical protein
MFVDAVRLAGKTLQSLADRRIERRISERHDRLVADREQHQGTLTALRDAKVLALTTPLATK